MREQRNISLEYSGAQPNIRLRHSLHKLTVNTYSLILIRYCCLMSSEGADCMTRVTRNTEACKCGVGHLYVIRGELPPSCGHRRSRVLEKLHDYTGPITSVKQLSMFGSRTTTCVMILQLGFGDTTVSYGLECFPCNTVKMSRCTTKEGCTDFQGFLQQRLRPQGT